MDGWTEDIRGARRIEDLPRNTRRYIERLEELAGVRMVLVSVGPDRDETIVLKIPSPTDGEEDHRPFMFPLDKKRPFLL